MGVRQDAGDLLWTIKLLVGLGVLGALLGAAADIYALATYGGYDASRWQVRHWWRWFQWLIDNGYSSEIITAAVAGASALVAPVVAFFIRPRRTS